MWSSREVRGAARLNSQRRLPRTETETAVDVTADANRQQVEGHGELRPANHDALICVGYQLEIGRDDTVTGLITAPPFQRLGALAASASDLLLRLSSGGTVALRIRAYEPRPGGSAQIAGQLLPNHMRAGEPVAA